jgi:hypothetical protein
MIPIMGAGTKTGKRILNQLFKGGIMNKSNRPVEWLAEISLRVHDLDAISMQ